MNDVLLDLAKDGFKKYDAQERIIFYEKMLLTKQTSCLIKNFPLFLDEVTDNKQICLKCLKVLIPDKNIWVGHNSDQEKKLVLKLLKSSLDKRYIDIPLFINSIIAGRYYDDFLIYLFKNDLNLITELLRQKFLYLGELIQGNLWDRIKIHVNEPFICEFIDQFRLTIPQYYSLLSDNEKFIDLINRDIFVDLLQIISLDQYSFNQYTSKKINNTKLNLNSQIFLKAMTSDTKQGLLISMYKKIEKNMKMKNMLIFKETFDYFLNSFHLFKKPIFTIFCETKGATIAKLFFKKLIDDLLSTNKINSLDFCKNFIVLINITQCTILEMIEDGIINEKDLYSSLISIITKYPDIASSISVSTIQSFKLYENKVLNQEIISKLIFESLQNYKSDDDNSQLSSLSLVLLEKVLKEKIMFLDSYTIFNFLADVVKENKSSIESLNLISKLEQNLNLYDCADICKILRIMIKEDRLSDDFLHCLLQTMPNLKKYIIDEVVKNIKIELQLKELNNEEDYDLDSPWTQLYDLMTIGNLKQEKKDQTKFIECKLNSEIINVKKLKQILVPDTKNIFRKDIMTCNICLSNNIEMVYNPCGHMVCQECHNFLPNKKKCPICSTESISVIKLYFI